jgi:hypothetical protein
MTSYLYIDKCSDRNIYIVISPDSKRDGLLKSTSYKNEKLEIGTSHFYGKRHQNYLNELIKKSTVLN